MKLKDIVVADDFPNEMMKSLGVGAGGGSVLEYTLNF